jgi:hypothetical protein
MSPVVALVLLAGLSESAGRVLPLLARRSELSRSMAVGFLITGTLVEATVIAVWPTAAWFLAGLVQPADAADAARLAWTPHLVAPLVLAAIIAFPLLGPALHLVLLVAVGVGLTDPLATSTGLNWGAAAGCVAVAGVGLAAAVAAVRRLVSSLLVAGVPEPVT